MEVMVFKTSVETPNSVKKLKPLLDVVAGNNQWNFALDDCDRILRVVSAKVSPQNIIGLLLENGFICRELDD
jgi:hypothetical protein